MKNIKAVLAICLAAVITAAFTSCSETKSDKSSDKSSASTSAGASVSSGKHASTPEECLQMSCDIMKDASGSKMLDCIPDVYLNGLFEKYDTDRETVVESLDEKLVDQVYADDEGNEYSYTDIEKYTADINESKTYTKEEIEDMMERIKALNLEENGFDPDSIEEISRIVYNNNITFNNGKTSVKKGLTATFIKYEGSWYALTAMTGLEAELKKG